MSGWQYTAGTPGHWLADATKAYQQGFDVFNSPPKLPVE